jgi:hypothetical protein
MGVLLEIKTGPFAGKKVAVVTGQTVTFGRAEGRAQFALPHDTFMSGVHFAVECGTSGCRVVDRKSSNGTFLNGAKIQDAMLANGDEIKGGQTVFAVKIVADAKLASIVPPQEDGLTSSSARRRRAIVPDPSPEPPAPRAEESKPAPINADPRPPRPPVADPVPPLPAGGPAVAPMPPPARPRVESPEPQSIQASNMGVPAAEARPVGSDPSPRKSDRSLGPAAKNVAPQVEEAPNVRVVPRTPSAEPSSPRPAESAPVSAKPPRAAEPPAGIAPHIAQKFGEDPAARAGSSRNFAFTVMGWSFPAAPAEWQVQEGFGLQQSGHEDFPSSVAATEELLGGITLQQFVESQISMLRGYLRDPKIEPTMPPRVGGADESMAVDVRHSTKDGRELVYRRIYARSGASVGVLTVTTLAADLPQVLQTLQPLLEGVAFRATANN